jgi:hypothetical protein
MFIFIFNNFYKNQFIEKKLSVATFLKQVLMELDK